MNSETEDGAQALQSHRMAYDCDDPLELMLEESCRVATRSLLGLALEAVRAKARCQWGACPERAGRRFALKGADG
jgi:hypothetical protein